MLQTLKTLSAALAAFDGGEPVAEDTLDLLGLAIASLEKLEIAQLDPALCQVAVLGPTQAGKSTLVNLLVGSEVTTVSALAGHTRHARGAALGVADAVLQRIADALSPAQRVNAAELLPDNLDQYSLLSVGEAAFRDATQAAGPVEQDLSLIHI